MGQAPSIKTKYQHPDANPPGPIMVLMVTQLFSRRIAFGTVSAARHVILERD